MENNKWCIKIELIPGIKLMISMICMFQFLNLHMHEVFQCKAAGLDVLTMANMNENNNVHNDQY